MSGFDHLIASSLEKIITKNLGKITMLKIEKRLKSKYGISLTESIEQFQKFDAILREFFGAGADGLEKQFLKSICKVKESKNSDTWFSIEDEMIKKIILEAYGDENNIKVLDNVNQKSMIISDILDHCRFPQTSGYRRINNLINLGLLVEDEHVLFRDNKKILKYYSLFKSVRINIVKNKLNIEIQFDKTSLRESIILQTIFNF